MTALYKIREKGVKERDMRGSSGKNKNDGGTMYIQKTSGNKGIYNQRAVPQRDE